MEHSSHPIHKTRHFLCGMIAIALVLVTLPASAQDLAQACQGLLKDGLRNVARTYRTEDIERVAYKRHCSKQNDRYSFSDDAEFMWYFGATASPNFDVRRGEEWCKENASRLDHSSANFLEVLTFSQEALRAFNDCMSLQKQNVLADAKIENDTLIISVWRNTGRSSYLQRFDFDKAKLNCSATAPSDSGKSVEVVLSEPIRLVDDLRVNIICRRISTTGEPGVRAVRSKTTVALTTDLSTPLAITLAEEKDLEPTTIDDLRAAIALIAEPHVIVPWLPFDWEGKARPIPRGWAICDGSPEYGPRFADLKERFLIGGDEKTAGSKGGSTGFNWRSGKYEGSPEREYLHKASGNPDLRPPWYSVVFLCRIQR